MSRSNGASATLGIQFFTLTAFGGFTEGSISAQAILKIRPWVPQYRSPPAKIATFAALLTYRPSTIFVLAGKQPQGNGG